MDVPERKDPNYDKWSQPQDQEVSVRTRSYDILQTIKHRRFVWLEHLLSLKGKRLVKLTIEIQFERKSKEGFLMKFPSHLTFGEITTLEHNRKL